MQRKEGKGRASKRRSSAKAPPGRQLDIDDIVVGKKLMSSSHCDIHRVKRFTVYRELSNIANEDCKDEACEQEETMLQDHSALKPTTTGDRRQYTIKFIKQELMKNSSHEEFEFAASSLENEAELLLKLDHPNISKIRATSAKGTEAYYVTGRHDSYFLILDRMKSSLSERLEDWSRQQDRRGWAMFGVALQWKRKELLIERLTVALEIARALEYLHREGIAHRNIRPENIGFQDGKVQLLEFGLACKVGHSDRIDDALPRSAQLNRYVAPELVLGQAHGSKADVYSFATLLCEVLALRGKLKAKNGEKKTKFCEFQMEAALDALHLKSSTDLPYIDDLLTIIQSGWSLDPADRPKMSTFREAIENVLRKVRRGPQIVRSRSMQTIDSCKESSAVSVFSSKEFFRKVRNFPLLAPVNRLKMGSTVRQAIHKLLENLQQEL